MQTNPAFRCLPALVLALLFMTAAASGQAPKKLFSEVYYHKIKPGHTFAEARAIENEWKKIHQAQVNEGNLISWYMLALEMTSNPNKEYDYITTKSFGSLGHLDNSYPQATLEEVWGADYKARWADLNKRTGEVQEGGKVEIWENLDSVFDPAGTPYSTPVWRISSLNIKDSKYDEYIERNKKIKLMYQEDIKAGRNIGWGLWSLALPYASEKGYDLASLVQFPSMKVMEEWQNAAEATFKKVMPDTDPKQFYAELNAMRETARQEIYYLVEYAGKSPATTVQAAK